MTTFECAPPEPAEDAGMLGSLLHDEIGLLPLATSRFHASTADVCGSGILEVRQARRWYGRLIARMLRLPRTSGATRVTLTIHRERAGTSEIVEYWSRRFDGQAMDSIQTASAQHVVEQIGRLELRFAISVASRRLCFEQVGTSIRVGPRRLPVPTVIAPRVHASVGGDEEHLDVSVRIDAPLLGTVLSYAGKLRPESAR